MEAVPCDDIRGMTLSPSFNHEVEEAFLRRSAPSLFGSSSTIPLPEALPEEVPAIHDDFFATPEDQYSRQPEQLQFVLHVKQEAHDHYEVFQQQPPTQSEGLQQPQDGPMHQEVRFEIVLPTQTSQPPSESSARATGRRQSVVDLVMEKFFPEELLQKQPTSEQPGPETFSANAQDHIALARQSSPKSVVSHSDYATSVSVAPHPATEEPPLPTIVRRKSVSGGSKNRKSDEEVTMAARKRRKSVNDAAFPTPQPSEDAKKVETKPRTTSSSANRLRNRRASLPVLSIVSGKGKLVDFKPAPDTDDEGVRSLEEPLRSTQIQDDEGGVLQGCRILGRDSVPRLTLPVPWDCSHAHYGQLVSSNSWKGVTQSQLPPHVNPSPEAVSLCPKPRLFLHPSPSLSAFRQTRAAGTAASSLRTPESSTQFLHSACLSVTR